MDSLDDGSPPTRLSLVNSCLEKIIKKQVLEIRLSAVCLGDICKEYRANDTSTTPHKSNGWIVQFPVVLFGGLAFTNQYEDLLIGVAG